MKSWSFLKIHNVPLSTLFHPSHPPYTTLRPAQVLDASEIKFLCMWLRRIYFRSCVVTRESLARPRKNYSRRVVIPHRGKIIKFTCSPSTIKKLLLFCAEQQKFRRLRALNTRREVYEHFLTDKWWVASYVVGIRVCFSSEARLREADKAITSNVHAHTSAWP